MLWIAIHLPQLPVQVFCRADEHHAPLVVCPRGPRRAVLAANAAAAACGITPGTRLASALALAPQLIVRERAPLAESALLEELAQWALQFTPQTSLDPPHGVLLEIAASLNLFGGLDALLQRIHTGCEALGLTVSMACAPTPLAARLLSLGATHARITDPADLPTALAMIPVDCAVDHAATRKLFHGLGCHTLGDCYPLPRAGLAQRGTQHFLLQLDQALGRLPDPRPAWAPPPHFHARLELPCEFERADALVFGCRRLLTTLSGALTARQHAIERFTLTLEHAPPAITPLEIHLGRACHDEARFLLLTREHLERLTLPAPVRAITLTADHWQAAPQHNHSLFHDPTQQQENLATLTARLKARLGQQAVTQLCMHDDHRPEHATQAHAPDSAQRGSPPAPPRPLWLLDTPTHLTPGQHNPWVRLQLTKISGPERIESGWWDGDEVRRDYYIARTPEAVLLWIFQDLKPPHDWYLHGLFS